MHHGMHYLTCIKHGHEPEVLVRHEDDRFITEWVYGEDLHPDDASRPAGSKQPGRSGA
jgi:hypothetical protein